MGKLNSSIKAYPNLFPELVSPENLFAAWEEFRKGKLNKADVRQFELNLERNIFHLHRDLVSGNYVHGPYKPFYIRDPKQRLIHKATVRDRIVHHAIFAALNPIFEPTFSSYSFSCRKNFGTHRGVATVETMLRKASRNFTRDAFALKCDVKKFFASVSHATLLEILSRKIKDDRTLKLASGIISSYATPPPYRLVK